MNIGPLTLFNRMHSNGTPIKSITVAAWHWRWRWSITWRWALWWYPVQPRGWFPPHGYFRRTYRGEGFDAGVYLPWLGALHLHVRPNMPWRTKT